VIAVVSNRLTSSENRASGCKGSAAEDGSNELQLPRPFLALDEPQAANSATAAPVKSIVSKVQHGPPRPLTPNVASPQSAGATLGVFFSALAASPRFAPANGLPARPTSPSLLTA
jgi:hypothetical protein